MPTTTRRITSTTSTIPAPTSLAGTVTADTVQTVLIYSGSEDIHDYVNEGNSGYTGIMYLYVPSATPKLSKILGVYLNANGTTSITVATSMGALSGAACDLVIANLWAYSYVNDGAAACTVDGVSIVVGDAVSITAQQGVNTALGSCQLPVYVDASSTSLLISETTS